MLFVGWDWASESHDVAVLDEDATTVDRWALGHGAEGIGDAHSSSLRRGRARALTAAANDVVPAGSVPAGARS